MLLVALAPTSTQAADPLPEPPPPTQPGTLLTIDDPPGANDWSCRATTRRPVPVVLVHGTFGDREHLLDVLSSTLSARGWCVYSLDYGNRGTGDIAASARQLRTFVDRVRRSTGATKVSMVGHSQGGMMPRYYIKRLGGARFVDDLVGLAPSNHGTRIVFSPNDAVLGDGLAASCPACRQQGAGSAFLEALNAGDETPGDVSYTQLITRYDEVVVPATSGFLAAGPRTTNLTLQDVCPVAPAEHLQIPRSSTAVAVALDALTRPGPARASLRTCG